MLIINGKEPGEMPFDPTQDWASERTFQIKPGATDDQIRWGIKKALGEVLVDFKKFVHPKCWRYMQWFVIPPKKGMQGRLGWRYVAPKVKP